MIMFDFSLINALTQKKKSCKNVLSRDIEIGLCRYMHIVHGHLANTRISALGFSVILFNCLIIWWIRASFVALSILS
jgi:hypothetical protein